MIAVLQRVKTCTVTIDGKKTAEIGAGLLVLLGVGQGDTPADVDYLAEKTIRLRIFEDDAGKMNRSVQEIGGAVMVVSQFTLLGDCRKGRRPSFIDAAKPDVAVPLYERFIDRIRTTGLQVETGRFGAMMDVGLINDGPVTLILDSRFSAKS
uniref:D-aminoacyl-tRNA deacylase n=1 Tax=Desulfatirhabdium butyrativorans TaxID=340467 RepID=A0A7C4RTL5_9BACT